MSRKNLLLLSLLPLTLALQGQGLADTNTTQADQPAKVPKPGLMSRFAGLFDAFDTSKPENQHVFVIGSSTPKTAEAAGKPSGEATAATGPNADSPGDTRAQAPSPPGKVHGHGFTLSSGFQASDGQSPATAADHPPQ